MVQQWADIGFVGHVAHTEERRCAHRFLVGKPNGNKPFGRSRHRWKNNIKMDLKEIERGERGLVSLLVKQVASNT